MKEYEAPDKSKCWINRKALEEKLTASNIFSDNPDVKRMTALLDELETEEGYISFPAEWEKVLPGDPDMDETERTMFPDETYRCSRCKGKGYFGAACTKDRYCQRCGAKMMNAGNRVPAAKR